MRNAILLTALALAGPTLAQAPTATIPQGYLATEGDSSHWVPVRYGPARSQTTYDATAIGLSTGTINQLSLRADGTNTTAFAAHAFRFTVHLSSAGLPAAAAVSTQSYAANHGTDRTRVLNNARVDFPTHQNPVAMPTWVPLPISAFAYAAGSPLQVEMDVATLSGGSENHPWYADAVNYGSGQGTPGTFVRTGAGDACPGGTLYGGAVGGPGETLSIWFYTGGGSGVPAVLYLGSQTATFQGMPLPIDLSPFGFAGCSLRTDMIADVPGWTDSAPGLGRYRVDIGIPSIGSLAGQNLYSQNFSVDAALPGGFSASDLGTITIGQPATLPAAVHLYTYTAGIDDVPQFAANAGLVLGVN